MNLIVSPHIDDEVLGCFTAIGPDSFVLYCGSDESRINFEWVKERPTSNKRMEELKALQNKIGFKYEILPNAVNHYHINDLIPSIELVINRIKPEAVYIPVPSYNQDHRSAYEASLTALRPHDVNHFVPRVMIYEQLQDLWNHNYHPFQPTYFRKLDIEAKIAAYQVLATQVRSFRSPQMLRNLAAVRGIQCNQPYAEGFEIIRWVE